MIGDMDWVSEEWKFSLEFIEKFGWKNVNMKDLGVFVLCRQIVDEVEDCGGYIP